MTTVRPFCMLPARRPTRLPAALATLAPIRSWRDASPAATSGGCHSPLPRLLGCVVVLTTAVVLGACAAEDDAPASAPTTEPPALSCDDVAPPPTPAPGGELTFGVQVDPLTAVCAQAAALAVIREESGAYPADLAAATASPTEGLFPAPQGYTYDPATDTFTVCVGDPAGSATYDSATDAVTLADAPC